MKRNMTVALLFGVALALGMALGGLFQTPKTVVSAEPEMTENDRELAELRPFADKLGKLFSGTTQKVSPAVVWIQAEKIV